MYPSNEGGLRIVRDGADLEYLHAGDFFGELSLLHHGPREATVEALTDCRCSARPGALFDGCSRVSRSFASGSRSDWLADFRRVAGVPLDFAERSFPARSRRRQIGPEQVDVPRGRAGRRGPAVRERPRRARGRDASRTSTSSTRWTAAPRAWPWSPLLREGDRHAASPRSRLHGERRDEPARDRARRRGARAGCARCAHRRAVSTRCPFPHSPTWSNTLEPRPGAAAYCGCARGSGPRHRCPGAGTGFPGSQPGVERHEDRAEGSAAKRVSRKDGWFSPEIGHPVPLGHPAIPEGVGEPDGSAANSS